MTRILCGCVAVLFAGWALGLSLVVIALTRAPVDRLLDW
jgi:hypothetical protein